VFEVTVDIKLEGDFEDSYLTGDNKNIVATDTMKNTVYYLAKHNLSSTQPLELFAQSIVQHFLKSYAVVSRATVDLSQDKWERPEVPGTDLEKSFTKQSGEKRTVSASLDRKGTLKLVSGLRGLVVLKTSGSGFAGFPRCHLTTLAEVTDRLLCTSVTAFWTYTHGSVLSKLSYDTIFQDVRNLIINTFTINYSNSVQQVIYDIGQAVIEKVPQVDELSMVLPNIHIFPFDIDRFGLQNNDEVYIPIDEPSGYIEGSVKRTSAKAVAARSRL